MSSTNPLSQIIMEMKASRRKQTKPSRVPFGVETHSRAVSPPRYPRPTEEYPPYEMGSAADHTRGEEGETPMDMSLVSCSTCSQTFSSQRDLREHVKAAHGTPPAVEEDWRFPTAYHRLGSQLVQEHALPHGGPSDPQEQALALTQPRPQDDERQPPEETSREQREEYLSVKVNGGSIFQPDTYCELCDREFCNKYFLKTHLAAKHGIYDSPSPTSGGPLEASPQMPSRQQSSSPKTAASPSSWQNQEQRQPEQSLQQQQQEKLQRESQQLPPEKGRDDSQAERSGSCRKTEAELATEEKVSSVISAVKSSLQGKNGAGKSSSSSGGNTTKDPTSEDYCQFCQKHFCNKYYLKKHKQDVHGIIPETGPTPTKRSRGSSSNSSMLDLPISSSAMGSPLLLPPPMGSLPPGMMMLNPFMPQMALMPPGGLSHQPLLHPHQLLPSPLSPATSQSLVLPGMGPSTPSPRASSALSPPRSDTFCGLCRKEFSNVYFLKIHQVNKHGLQCEEVDHEARMLGDMVENSGVHVPPRSPAAHEGPQQQDAPPRLSPPPLTSTNRGTPFRPGTDREGSGSAHQPGGPAKDRSRRDSYDSAFPRDEHMISSLFTEAVFGRQGNAEGFGRPSTLRDEGLPRPSERLSCDLCSMEVPSRHALRMHKLHIHGVATDTEDDRAATSADRKQQYSPGMGDMAQPLNMSLSSRAGPPPPLMLPKPEPGDFADYKRDMHKMERAAFKAFADVPSILSETINNEYGFNRHQVPGPFAGLDLGPQGPPSAVVLSKLESEQLAREGVDPEAYCNICKKELCSKYFLRTHMEKTHGIKMETPPSNLNRSKTGSKPGGVKAGPVFPGQFHDDLRAAFPMPGMPFSFPPGLMPGDAAAGARGGPGFPRGRSGFEKSHFRWKTSSSATARVTCDICNKEVCNKYFLRTHKLKKHGVAPTDSSSGDSSTTPTVSTASSASHASQPDNFLMDKGTGMLPLSHPASIPYSIPLPPSERNPSAERPTLADGAPISDRAPFALDRAPVPDRSSVFDKSSVYDKPPSYDKPPTYDKPPAYHKTPVYDKAPTYDKALYDRASLFERAPVYDRSPDSDRLPLFEGLSLFDRPPLHSDRVDRPLQRTGRAEEEEEKKIRRNDLTNEGEDSVACHKCDRRFRNQQWLAAHLLKDHGEADMMERYSLPPPLAHFPELGMELEPRPCPVCRALLPSELSLQLHLVHKHNALVRLQLDDGVQEEAESRGSLGLRPGRALGLRARLWRGRTRNCTRKLKMFVCSFGDYRTHWLYKLQAHEENTHGIMAETFKGDGVVGARSSPDPQLDGVGLSANPIGHKPFKCRLCPARFPTHTLCQTHLREKHIHALKDFVSRKRRRLADSRLSCRFCSYTTSFPFRLHSHVTRFHSGHPLQEERGDQCFVDLASMVSSETPPESVHGSPDHEGLGEAAPFDIMATSARSQPPMKDLLQLGEDKEGGSSGGAGSGSLTGRYLSPVSSQHKLQEPV